MLNNKIGYKVLQKEMIEGCKGVIKTPHSLAKMYRGKVQARCFTLTISDADSKRAKTFGVRNSFSLLL